MPTAYLSLGSNLGDRELNLREALKRLNTPDARITAVSRIFETRHVGDTEERVPDYLNCVAQMETALFAESLLQHTQAVERAGGRVPTFRWGPRSIDIDILMYGDLAIATEALTIPHPRMFDRAFVLKPLADLIPDIIFPDGATLADRLTDPAIASQQVRP